MTGVKTLQVVTLGLFLVYVVTGFLMLFLAPDKMHGFQILGQAVFPFFLAEIIPAIIGKPLKTAVEKMGEKNDTRKHDQE
jgi:uncharacterized membrane protein YvlD (DUF360 family)